MGHAAKVKRARREVRAVAQVLLTAPDGGADFVATWRWDFVGRPSEEGTQAVRRWTPRRQMRRCHELRRAMGLARVPTPIGTTLLGTVGKHGRPCAVQTMPGWSR